MQITPSPNLPQITATHVTEPENTSTYSPSHTVTSSVSFIETPTVIATSKPYQSCNQPGYKKDNELEAAFIAEWDGYSQVYFTKGEEIHRKPLREEETSITPVYSPDGSKLAYISQPTGASKSSLSVISLANGVKIFELTEPEPYGFGLSWSSDGVTIAFISSGEAGVYDLYTVNISDGKVTNLTKGEFGYPIIDPSFSTSGQFVAVDFLSDRGGQTGSSFIIDKDGIWITYMPGDRIDALLPHMALVFDPKWSPTQDILLLTVWTWPYPIRKFQIGQLFQYERAHDRIRMITDTETSNMMQPGPPMEPRSHMSKK